MFIFTSHTFISADLKLYTKFIKYSSILDPWEENEFKKTFSEVNSFSFWDTAANLFAPFLVLNMGVDVFLNFMPSISEVCFLICSCCGKEALEKWLWHLICKVWGLWSFSSLAPNLCKFSITLFSVGCTFSCVPRAKGHQPGCHNFPWFWFTISLWGWKDAVGWVKPCTYQWWGQLYT